MQDISTHTLTWSVTYALSDLVAKKKISTHTLTWSVTQFSQTSEGLRLISTHTLTWSVTMIFHYKFLSIKNFNSHAHVERDNF